MPPDASKTREKLIDAAARAFADDGVFAASLVDITRKAGQRNKGALHYHFGSREAVLCAVLERHADFLARREGELLELARLAPDDDVGSVVEAIVRPAAELAESGWRGRAYLSIVAQLAQEDPSSLSDDVNAALAHTGGYQVYGALLARIATASPSLTASVSPDVTFERLALVTAFILGAVADRARADGRRRRGRPQLDQETFVRNLVAMAAAAVSAPLT